MDDVYARSWLILRAFWGQFRELTPMWLFGVALGATLAWWLRPYLHSRIGGSRALRLGSAPLQLLAGAMLGIASPFSLLSLAGLIRELLRDRRAAPLALGLAMANPLLNPTILTFTWLALGPRFALLRIATTLAAALIGGAILLRLPGGSPPPDQPADEGAPLALRTWRAYLRYLAREIVVYGRYYLLALILAAWLDAFAPLQGLWAWMGRTSSLATPLAALVGGPFYLCGGGAVALARELLAQGVGAGAVLAFISFGPAVTIRTLTAMTAIGGRRMTAVFAASALAVALAVGYLAR